MSIFHYTSFTRNQKIQNKINKMNLSRQSAFVAQKTQGGTADKTQGAEERKATKLTELGQSYLDFIKSPDGKTEADMVLYFCLEPSVLEKGEGAVHSGIAPRTVLTGISNQDSQLFLVADAMPAVCQEWHKSRAQYHNWAFSSTCFATFEKESKSFKRGEWRVTTVMDKFETMQGVFCGSLHKYWKTGDKKVLSLLYRFLISCNHHSELSGIFWDVNHKKEDLIVCDKKETVIDSLTKETVIDSLAKEEKQQDKKDTDHLLNLYQTRDKDRNSLYKFYEYYRSAKNKTDVTSYYQSLLDAVKKAPDLLHTSKIPRLDYVLCAIMSLPHGSIDTIQKELLDGIMTVAIKQMVQFPFGLEQKLTRDELVKFIHESIPVVGHILKSWAFITSVHRLITQRSHTLPQHMDSFVEKIQEIRTQLFECQSLPALCQIIAPVYGKSFTNEVLAESIFSSSHIEKDEKKFVMFSFKKDEKEPSYPVLDAQVKKNNAAVKEFMDKKKDEKSYQEIAKKELKSVELGELLFNSMYKAEKKEKGNLQNDCMRNLRDELMNLAYDGSEESLTILKHVDSYIALKKPVSVKWFNNVVCRTSLEKNKSAVRTYFNQDQKRSFQYTSTKRKSFGFRKQLHLLGSIYARKASDWVSDTYNKKQDMKEEKEEKLDGAKEIKLLPFESAHVTAYQLRRVFEAEECFICMKKVKVFAIHDQDKRHSACLVCTKSIMETSKKCPFCRKQL